MNGQLDLIMRRVWERKLSFFLVFFFVVLITYAFLVIIDFIPESKDATGEQQVDKLTSEGVSFVPDFSRIDHNSDDTDGVVVNQKESTDAGKTSSTAVEETDVTVPAVSTRSVSSDSLPVRIIFEDLNNKEVRVLNPTASDIASLDHALLSGAVRYPESADFSEPGNVFILGHSSYLPNVLNKNFQAFNGIQKLTWGDTIRVQSGDTEYLYRVEEVTEAPASEIFVPDTPGESKLTLATCNVLGAKEDRYVVEAKLYDTRSL